MPFSIDPTALAAFLAITLVVYVAPGPDWLIVFQQATSRRRFGLAAAAGAQTSLCVHTALAATGVSALLAGAPAALTVLELLGAAYLVYLGARILLTARRQWRSLRSAVASRGEDPAPPAAASVREAFVRGFTTNILNPKAVLFFLSVVPRFVDPAGPVAGQILVFGIVDIVLGLAWWTVFVLAAGQFGRLLERPRIRLRVDIATGSVLAVIGLLIPVV